MLSQFLVIRATPVDLKDMDIQAQQRRVSSLEETCQDLEGTIAQFRDLVMQLQTYAICQLISLTCA